MSRTRAATTQSDILGVRVDAVDLNQSLELIADWIDYSAASSRVVIKPYVEFMVAARKDHALLTLLNESDLSLADGVSLQWAASYLYGQPASKPSLRKLVVSLLVWLQRADWKNQV